MNLFFSVTYLKAIHLQVKRPANWQFVLTNGHIR